MKRFLIIGLGRFGMSLAETLSLEGAEVIAVDSRMDRVEDMKDKVAYAAQLDGTDPDALKSVGADRVDTAVIAIGENFEASVVATAILKEIGLKEIIVRAYTERERKILELIGASRVIFVEDEMGRRLGKTVCGDAFLDYIELSSTHSIVQWATPRSLIGRTLADLNLGKGGLVLLAVKRPEASKGSSWDIGKGGLEVSPPSDYPLEPGDILILMGKNRDLTRFTSQKKEGE
jgi:trk system potassium uptake protein TrkA